MTRFPWASHGMSAGAGNPEPIPTPSEFTAHFSVLRSVLQLMGTPTSTPEEAYEAYQRLPEAVKKAFSVTDAHTVLFARNGWILFDGMESDVIQDAMKLVEAGEFDEAEQILVGFYNASTIGHQLKRMRKTESFRPHAALGEKAQQAQEKNRRQESVPYVLALVDRLVQEVYQKFIKPEPGQKDKPADLQAWDGFADHCAGLKQLKTYGRNDRLPHDHEQDAAPHLVPVVRLMNETHADEYVTAKAWTALFSAGEWAIEAERGVYG